MAEANTSRYAVRLSDAELRVLLSILEVDQLVSHGDNPWASLPEEQQRLAAAVATDGLRARRLLATLNGSGPVVYRELLDTLATCVAPSSVLAAFHWAAGAPIPTQLYCLRNRDKIVLHGRPETSLHEFVRLPSAEAAIDQLLRFCGLVGNGDATFYELTLPREELQQLRASLETGDVAAAATWQAQHEDQAAAAAALVGTLKGPYQAALIRIIRSRDGDTLSRREVTYLYGSEAVWVIQNESAEAEGPVQIQTVNVQQIRALLAAEI